MALPEDNRFLYSDDAGCNSRSIGASDMQTHSESTADAPAAASGKTASADFASARDKNEDTIAAIATAMTEAGIGIIRVSGPDSICIVDKIFRNARHEKAITKYRANTIHFGYIVGPIHKAADQSSNNLQDKPQEEAPDTPPQTKNTSSDTWDGDCRIIDEVMVSVMKAPHSYTTEDTVEINTHGGVYLLNRILELVLANGARLAEPGEFTKRAFLGGRIDLSQAEAVMDLISSQNEFSRRTAVDQLEGSVCREVRKFRESILYETAFIESALDDPENYSTDGYPQKLDAKLNGLVKEMNHLLEDSENARILKEGIRTVIVGRPNAGKSSLLNYLSHSDRAIVTDVAGTTRDTLEESVRLGGCVLHLIDTAGIHKTKDTVEKIGVDRAVKAAERADLLLFLIDTSDALSDEDRMIADLVAERTKAGAKAIVLLNKSDLTAETSEADARRLFEKSERAVEEKTIRTRENTTDKTTADNIPSITISLANHSGLDQLTKMIETMFRTGELMSSSEVYMTNIRQRDAMIRARDSLLLVRKSIADGMSEDFYTIDLMNAYSSLGEIIGEQVDDDLVDEIFSKFCMGK